MKIMPVEHSESSPSEAMPISSSADLAPPANDGGARPSSQGIEAFYRSDHERLWKSLLAFTGDAEIASRAEAETFTQALAQGGELRDPSAWIWRNAFGIATEMIGDPNRSVGQAKLGEIEVDPSTVDAPMVELLSALETLPEQQRTIVVLRYVGGFRPAEIASLVETSLSTVSAQLNQAHDRLRKSV